MNFSPTRTRRLAHSRGFTLIELMVVVVIVSILASIAMPQILNRMRERRANQGAQEIGLLYRNARLRAMGQGFAVLVRYSAAGFEVREAMPFGSTTGNCTLQLPLSCTTNPWAVANTDYRVIGSLDPNAYTVSAAVSMADSSSTTTLDMCFTPRGRTFARVNTSAQLLPITGVVTVKVTRATSNNVRTVSILPNGMARLAQ